MKILLFLLIIFILFPLLRVVYTIWRSVRQVKKAFSQQQQQYQQTQKTSHRQASKEESNQKKRRAIEFLKNKSEDAEYEEIPGKRKSTATDDDREPASSRPHYTDAHYEDVK